MNDLILISFLLHIQSIVPDTEAVESWWLKFQLIELLSMPYNQAVEVYQYMLSKGFILLSEGGSHD